MNLVLVGTFQEAATLAEVQEAIGRITDQVLSDESAKTLDETRYSDAMLALLGSMNILSISPAELEQFRYEYKLVSEPGKLVVTTEEIDVSAFVKLILLKGGKVEIYSAHDFPDSKYNRRSGR